MEAKGLGMSKKLVPTDTCNRAGMGEDFSPVGNEDRDFKYPHVKRGRGGDHYPHTRGYLI